MSVFGGNIGPRLPKVFGESCLNCGMAFIMQPGTVELDGKTYLKWTCAGCRREEYSPAPYNLQKQPDRIPTEPEEFRDQAPVTGGLEVQTSRDLVE